MKIWVRKLFVSFIAILTLGMYIPETMLEAEDTKEQDTFIPSNTNENYIESNISTKTNETIELSILDQLTEKAILQTTEKLGSKILKQIDEDFNQVIKPKIEYELHYILDTYSSGDLSNYTITENPSSGYGERIFNVTDRQNNDIIAKFHVRRDYKPLDGYWFNFHYHLANDNFEKHHIIADVFWDKNTPPKWMTS